MPPGHTTNVRICAPNCRRVHTSLWQPHTALFKQLIVRVLRLPWPQLRGPLLVRKIPHGPVRPRGNRKRGFASDVVNFSSTRSSLPLPLAQAIVLAGLLARTKEQPSVQFAQQHPLNMICASRSPFFVDEGERTVYAQPLPTRHTFATHTSCLEEGKRIRNALLHTDILDCREGAGLGVEVQVHGRIRRVCRVRDPQRVCLPVLCGGEAAREDGSPK